MHERETLIYYAILVAKSYEKHIGSFCDFSNPLRISHRVCFSVEVCLALEDVYERRESSLATASNTVLVPLAMVTSQDVVAGESCLRHRCYLTDQSAKPNLS
jgi:hypothetical protein